MATKKEIKKITFITNPRNPLEKMGWIRFENDEYVFPLNSFVGELQGDGKKVDISVHPELVYALMDSEYKNTIKFSVDGKEESNQAVLDTAYLNIGMVRKE